MKLFDKKFIKGEKQAFKRIGFNVALTLIVSFVGLGFSTGIRKNLELKMNDPFINNIEKSLAAYIKSDRRAKFDSINTNSDFKELLHINKIDLIGQLSLPIMSLTDTSPGYYYTRYYQHDYVLLQKILEAKNIAVGKDSIRANEYGVIVTEELLNKLGYQKGDYPEFIPVQRTLDIKGDGSNKQKVLYNFPISTVVKRLPGENSFGATQCFISNYMAGNLFEGLLEPDHSKRLKQYQRFDPRSKNDLTIFIPEHSFFKVTQIAEQIKTELLNNDQFKELGYRIKRFAIDTTYYTLKGGGSSIQYKMDKPTDDFLSPVKYPDYFECIQMFNLVKNSDFLSSYTSRLRILKNQDLLVNSSYTDEIIEGHILSLTFFDLDQAEIIASEFNERYHLDLEMTKVENAKNYKKVTWLSNISNAIILIISIIAVTLTTYFLLNTYLNGVKTSLGTLMAFGVKDIKKIYLQIIFEYLGWAWLIATVVVFSAQVILRRINPEEILLYLWSYYYLGLLLVMILLPIFIFWILDKSLFKKTPGDLIYER